MLKVIALCMLVVGYAAASSEFCSICEDGVAEIIKLAGDNEAKAKSILENECDAHLSHSWEKDICKEGVDLAVGEIMSLIKQHLSPQQVCAKVHLCSSRIAPLLNKKSSGLCQECNTIVNMVINAAENDQGQLVAACVKLGMTEAMCTRYVGLVEGLIAKYGKDAASKFCNRLPGCSNMAAKSLQEVAASKANTQLCQYCEEAVNVLDNLLKNEVPTIINDIKSLCQKLPGDEAQICSALVDQYGTMILNKVVALLDGQKVCTGIHLCSSSIEDIHFDLSKFGDGVDWNPVECNFCKMVFKFVQDNFMSQDFINALLMDIAKACKEIQSSATQQQCLNIIATYGDMILNYVKQLIAPDHICPMIKMCAST